MRFISLAFVAILLFTGCVQIERSSEPPKCNPSKPSVADLAAYELWGKDRGLKLIDCDIICAAHISVCLFHSSTGGEVIAYCNGNRSCKLRK